MSEVSDGLPFPQRAWAMVAQGLVITMAVLDGSIANIALPSIASDLAVSPSASIWVVNAYQVAITISLLPFAALGDIYGYRRVYTWGVVVFTLGSAGCALSHSLEMLTVARIIQGFGASGLMCVNTALVRFIFPRAKLGQGMGINSLLVSVSAAAGPSIASGVLSVAPWPALFALNVPIGIVTLAMTSFLPSSPLAAHRFHWQGALANTFMFGLGLAAVDGLGHGEAWELVLAEAAGAVASGWLLVRLQRGVRAPILPVELFANKIFSLTALTSVCSFVAATMTLVALPFLLEAHGMSTIETGLLITPWPLTSSVVAPLAGRLADRVPAGILGGIGLAVLTLGLIMVAAAPDQPQFVDMAWRMALCGGGFALFQAPNNRLLMASTPRERSGAGGGVLASCRLLGQTLGAALVGFAFATSGALDVVAGASLVISLAAFGSGAAMVVSLLRLRA